MNIWFWLFLGIPAALQFAVPPSAPIGWRRARTLAALVLATLFASLGLQDVFSDVAGRGAVSSEYLWLIEQLRQFSPLMIAVAAYLSVIDVGMWERIWRWMARRTRKIDNRYSHDRLGTVIVWTTLAFVAVPLLWPVGDYIVFSANRIFTNPYYDAWNHWTQTFVVVVPLLHFCVSPKAASNLRRYRTILSVSVGLVLMTLALMSYMERGLVPLEFTSRTFKNYLFFIILATPVTIVFVGILEIIRRQVYRLLAKNPEDVSRDFFSSLVVGISLLLVFGFSGWLAFIIIDFEIYVLMKRLGL